MLNSLTQPRLFASQKDELSSLHSVGTAAVVVQVTGTNWPQPSYTLLVTGLCRFKVESVLQETPYLVARVKQLDKLPGDEFGKMAEYHLFVFIDKSRNLILAETE